MYKHWTADIGADEYRYGYRYFKLWDCHHPSETRGDWLHNSDLLAPPYQDCQCGGKVVQAPHGDEHSCNVIPVPKALFVHDAVPMVIGGEVDAAQRALRLAGVEGWVMILTVGAGAIIHCALRV